MALLRIFRLLFLFVTSAWLSVFTSCGSCSAQESDKATDTRIEKLIWDLGAPDLEARENAETELRKLGARAERQLRQAASSQDPEVLPRVRRLLDVIELNQDPPIAFTTDPEPGEDDRGVYLVYAGSKRQIPLFKPRAGAPLSQAVWAPDGTKLVVYQWPGDTLEGLNLISKQGKEKERITIAPIGPSSLSWSPDSTKIAFTSPYVPEKKDEEERHGHVYIADVGTKELTRLTSCDHSNGDPCWSPDGQRLAFVSDRAGKGFDIYALDLQKTDPERITTDGGIKTDLVWSRDGKSILLCWRKEDEPELAILDLDRREMRKLTNEDGAEREAVWSPDGKRIAFTRVSAPDSIEVKDVFVIDRDGKNERRLVPGKGDKSHPTWSPDGKRIAFQWEREGKSEIYVVNADGTDVSQVTTTGGCAQWPTWAPYR